MDHLASLFDRALDAVVGMDHRGKVIAWNKAAEELFGWSHDEAINQPMGRLIVPPQHQASHAKGLSHYNKTREGPVLEQRLRLTAINRWKFEFPIELSIFPMRQPNGDIFYAFIRSLLQEEARRTEQERRTQEAQVLLQVARNLMEDVSLEDFIRNCLKAVCDVAGLDAAHAFYVRHGGDSGHLVPSGIWFVSDPMFQTVAEDTAARTFEKGQGLPGQAWAEGDVVVIESIPERADFIRRVSFSSVGLTQGLAVPIFQETEIFAVMEFFGRQSARIDEEMIRLVRTVAYQIGLAIQRKREAEEREILRRELAHRVGNSFAILNAILRATAKKSGDVSEFATSFSARLNAVSRAYKVISSSNDQRTLSSILDEAFELLPDKAKLQAHIPDLQVAPNAVLPLTLIFSELVTNHLKHGDPAAVGEIIVSAEINTAMSCVALEWKEPRSITQIPSSFGYGSFLITSMVERQLSGNISRSYGKAGLSVKFTVPTEFFV